MKKISILIASVTMAATTLSAKAASLLPADVFTNLQSDATATVTDVMSYVVPVGVAVSVGFAVLGWAKKGTNKALK